MPVPRLKICGMTNLADARYCAGVGADYLGFIQHPGSPRYVEPGFAKEIIEWLYGPSTVGVFVNSDADEVNDTCQSADFDIAQLHGDEAPDVCAAVKRPVIKVLRIGPDETTEALEDRMAAYDEHVDGFMFDTLLSGVYGGTGQSFDWTVAKSLMTSYRVFLAGGLDADNVAKAIRMLDPWALDISSSLESEPGRKDFSKVDAFMEVYRDAAREKTTE